MQPFLCHLLGLIKLGKYSKWQIGLITFNQPGLIYLRSMTTCEFKNLALSFPGTVEKPHFDRIAFKVITKRIFATLHEESGSANIRLPVKDQEVFCGINKSVYPVPNKWGTHGWTVFELKNIGYELALDALDTAYREVLKTRPKKK